MTFWGHTDHALALVELLQTGELRRRREQERAWQTALELGWARRTRRRRVLALDRTMRDEVEAALTQAWPDWLAVAERLEAAELEPTPRGLRELERLERLEAVSAQELPDRVNRRTAAALLGRHAKARLGPFERAALEAVDVTDDGLARMRPSAGLTVERDGVERDARELAAVLGELVLTDRALRDGTRLAGKRPRAVLTVENLGAYQDAAVADNVLVVHVPGWNTLTTRDLLAELEDVAVVHFGDLDPNGIAILAHLRRWRPDVRWLVPAFWAEYVDDKGLEGEWPEVALPPDAPAWVAGLRERGLWLEQEVVAVDPRLGRALEAVLRAHHGRA